MRYKKRNVIVEAVQWVGANKLITETFLKDTGAYIDYSEIELGVITLNTKEEVEKIFIDDWLIKETSGNVTIFYKCSKQNFEDMFEKEESLKNIKTEDFEHNGERAVVKGEVVMACGKNRKYKHGTDKEIKVLTKRYENERIELFLERLKLERKLKKGLEIKFMNAFSNEEKDGFTIWNVKISMKKNYDDKKIQKEFARMLKDVFSESWIEHEDGENKQWIKVINSKTNRIGD